MGSTDPLPLAGGCRPAPAPPPPTLHSTRAHSLKEEILQDRVALLKFQFLDNNN